MVTFEHVITSLISNSNASIKLECRALLLYLSRKGNIYTFILQERAKSQVLLTVIFPCINSKIDQIGKVYAITSCLCQICTSQLQRIAFRQKVYGFIVEPLNSESSNVLFEMPRIQYTSNWQPSQI